jgi:uncharacterized protein
LDTNLLVYAALPAMTEHDRTRAWLEDRFADPDSSVVLCWPVLYSFVRLLSSPRVMREDAVPVAVAWQAAMTIRRQPRARLAVPGPAHHEIAGELMATPGLTSRDVPDVQLAALAVEQGLTLATHDRGFARFSMLRWYDPLGSA